MIKTIKKKIIVFILSILILLNTSCATVSYSSYIDKFESPSKEIKHKNDNYIKFYGEYNGIVTITNVKYFEYIYYDVLKRKDNGHIKILINIENTYDIKIEEVEYKRQEKSNSILHYKFVNDLYEIQGEVTNDDMYINDTYEGSFSLYCKNNKGVSSITNKSVTIKYKERSVLLGMLFRTGYIVTVPVDIVTSPIQLLILIIAIFTNPGMV